MNKKPKEHRTSQRFFVQEICGLRVIMYDTESLDDESLQMSYRLYLAKEDYEYVAELVAEAKLRGIRLKA